MNKTEIFIKPDEAVYAISIVSQLLDIPIWTLRALDKKGVVKAKRRGVRHRFYCLNDIKTIEYVKYLMFEKGVNLEGVRVILEKEHTLITGR